MIDEKSSGIFWQIKAFAILTVFYAHLEWSGNPLSGHTLYESIGCIGVPLFMLMAGFFDSKSSASISQKAKRLFIPLIIWGTITFCVKLILAPIQKDVPTLAIEYLKWVYGCGTWYYFIAVLFWCQLLVRYVNVWVLVFMGITSMLSTSFNVIPYNDFFTPYTNPFNLIIYFIIGREYRLRVGDNISMLRLLVWLSITFIVLFVIVFKIPLYWNLLTPVFTLSLFILLWKLFDKTYRRSYFIVEIGKISMVLYLCHMQIAQALATRVCSLLGGGNFGKFCQGSTCFSHRHNNCYRIT